MSVQGMIRFFNEDNFMLGEHRYFTAEARRNYIQQYKELEVLSFFQISPDVRVKMRDYANGVVPDKPKEIVRQKGIYNNIPTYNYGNGTDK